MDKTIKEQLTDYVYKKQPSGIVRGDVFWGDFGKRRGHIQGGIRPAIIISNNNCNKRSPVLTVAPVTTSMTKNKLPTHVVMDEIVLRTSIVLCEGTTTINRSDLKEKIGHCTERQMMAVDKAVAIQMGLTNCFSVNSKYDEEIFDIYKVQKMVKNIKEMQEFINKFDNPMVQPVKDGMESLISELKAYCKKFGKDVGLFYKNKQLKHLNINKYLKKRKNQREALAIG